MIGKAALAATAIFATLARAQVGKATVLNLCPNTVYLANTPSADGIHTTQYATLENGQSYSQQYTALANSNGWSLKLGFEEGLPSGQIMQYEYTYQNEGLVWFDLSKVDGNPFGWFWNITSNDDACAVSQKAYITSDDNAAMQPSCDDTTDVTVVLCQWPDLEIAEQNGVSSLAGAVSSMFSAIEPTSTAPTTTQAAAPTTTQAAAPTTTQAPPAATTTSAPAPPASSAEPIVFASNGPGIPALSANHYHQAEVVSAVPTTLATSTIASTSAAAVEDADGNVEVVWYTNVVTEHVTFTTTQGGEATPVAKRHEHFAHGHAHAHQ